MSVGDIYQVRDIQSAFGEEVENVYYFQQTSISVGGLAADVAEAFVVDFLPLVRAIQPTIAIHTQLRVINGMLNADQAIIDHTLPGLIGSAAQSSVLAMAFRQRAQPGTIGKRWSYKRIVCPGPAYISESAGIQNTGGNFLALVEAVQNALGANLEGDEGLYQPTQITGGFRLTVAPTPSGTLLGRWQVSWVPSHQVSRRNYDWRSDITP